MIDGNSEGSLTDHGTGEEFTRGLSRVTVYMLPDVSLLIIFDFYVDEAPEAWHTLVHVCRNWRSIVFGSPLRLNLRLECTAKTPVRRRLEDWPPLPIAISVSGRGTMKWGLDSIFAALEHGDRVCQLGIRDTCTLGETEEQILAALHRPFPSLTCLTLQLEGAVPILSDTFLGGSAPRLQNLYLDQIIFPGLPNLLLSATHLVHLKLWRIPHSGYISPEAMVTGLSASTRLQTLDIRFGSFNSAKYRPSRKSRRPPTRTLLPVLTELQFTGVGKYLDNLVAWIDAPLLHDLEITFFCQEMSDTPQLAQFIGRAPKFKPHNEAHVIISDSEVLVKLPQTFGGVLLLGLDTLLYPSERQLSSLSQACRSSFHQALVLSVERLYIQSENTRRHYFEASVDRSQWLDLFRLFASVRDLYISPKFMPRIASALQELVADSKRVTEVLPALETLFLEEPLTSGPVQEIIGQFVAARQVADHPVAISRWENKEFVF